MKGKEISCLVVGMCMVLPCLNASAQDGIASSGVNDGAYLHESIPTKKMIQYPYLREADAMWSKRVWRTIDLREKMNLPLYYPLEPTNNRMSLWDVIKQGIEVEGSLTPYAVGHQLPYDDQFNHPVQPAGPGDPTYNEQLKELLYTVSEYDSLDEYDDLVYDPLTGTPLQCESYIPITAEDIVRYEIKEDWVFDKQTSSLQVRIVGIAPVVYSFDQEGDVRGFKTLFWLHFPECRTVFQNHYVFNRKNDSQRMSYDDLFWKRMFASYVHKESNVYDRKINEYTTGRDALLESERVKEELFIFEHDLWHY
jgi:gliding motility associated protien GldN